MSDIFLSYASEDLPRVLPLVRALEDRGWSVWWDRTILPGRTYDIVIEEALEAARCVIVVWSNTSVTSDWVKTEAAEGARRRILVPVALDEVRIPLEFRRIQAAQLMDWQDTDPHPEFEKVIRSVTGLLGPMSQAASIPSGAQPLVISPPEVIPPISPEPVLPVSPRAAPTEASQQAESQPVPSPASHASRPRTPVKYSGDCQKVPVFWLKTASDRRFSGVTDAYRAISKGPHRILDRCSRLCLGYGTPEP